MSASGTDDAVIEPASLVANTTWSTLSVVLGNAIVAIVSIVAVRTVSVGVWGQYSTAAALIAVFSLFAESGISTVALREMSAEPSRTAEILGVSLRAVALTASVSAPLMLGASLLLGYAHDVNVLVLIGLPSLVLYPILGLLRSAFNARRLMQHVAIFNVANAVVYGALALALLWAGAGTRGLMVATLVGYTVAAVIGTSLLARKLGVRAQLRVAPEHARVMMRAALGLAGIWVINVVYDRIDLLMLSKLKGSEAVAQYSVAYTGIRLTWLVPSLVATAFFPLLTSLLRERPDEARTSFFLLARIFMFVGVSLSAFLAFGGPAIVPFVFGARYHEAGGVLTILAWTSLITFQNYLLWYGVLACHKERAVLYLQLAGLAINVMANVILIPRYGTHGAAVALIISELWALGGQVVVVHRHLFPVPLARLVVKPALAAAVFVPMVFLYRTSALAAAVGAALLYPLLLQALGYISRTEWQPLLGPMGALLARVAPGGGRR